VSPREPERIGEAKISRGYRRVRTKEKSNLTVGGKKHRKTPKEEGGQKKKG